VGSLFHCSPDPTLQLAAMGQLEVVPFAPPWRGLANKDGDVILASKRDDHLVCACGVAIYQQNDSDVKWLILK
jgi:hypothetical protein